MSVKSPGRPRTLLGPGPSDMSPRVAEVLSRPLLGHLDPAYLAMMDETRELLRRLWRTTNATTLTISATGSGGREACLVNLIEPGDRVLVGLNGYFGGRLAETARRLGAQVSTVEAEWGTPLDPGKVIASVRNDRPAVTAIVHAETSTGVLARPEEMRAIGAAVRDAGSLLVVDCVTSLGGVAVDVDGWPADAAYSCSQKGLSCPPGLAPVTFSDRATTRVRSRKTPVPSVYFDLLLLEKYWGPDRVYHHTASASIGAALLESLRAFFEDGDEARFELYRRNTAAMIAGLEALGLSLFVSPSHRMPMVTPVRVPEGVSEPGIRRALLERDGIEIGAGLGPLAGKIWRIGLMGHSSRPGNIRLLIGALGRHLSAAGHRCDTAAALEAVESGLSARG